MATRSGNRNSSSRPRSRSTSTNRSAFRWGSSTSAAALGGAALAIVANLGRKLLSQSFSASQGNWADSLAAEHDSVLAIFDKMLATDAADDAAQDAAIAGYALDKHAYAEEHVVYPALREANDTADAEERTEHGEVKEFLYRLQHMELDAPNWLETIREFRQAVEAHAALKRRCSCVSGARSTRSRRADHQGSQQGRLCDGQPTRRAAADPVR